MVQDIFPEYLSQGFLGDVLHSFTGSYLDLATVHVMQEMFAPLLWTRSTLVIPSTTRGKGVMSKMVFFREFIDFFA